MLTSVKRKQAAEFSMIGKYGCCISLFIDIL